LVRTPVTFLCSLLNSQLDPQLTSLIINHRGTMILGLTSSTVSSPKRELLVFDTEIRALIFYAFFSFFRFYIWAIHWGQSNDFLKFS
jgi:hypothetical protein